MSLAAASDPDGAGSPTTSGKPGSSKDKACPFCGEKFTSSSLGRHLDLFIKEKNPKVPDGVHDVDAIRRIRSNITRRQPRKGTKQYAASTPNSNAGQPITTASPYGFTIGRDKNNQILVNRPTWEATGVITDIPTSSAIGISSRFRKPSLKKMQRSLNILKKQVAEERTRKQATELALRDMFDSVNASRLATPLTPFDFDFFAQNFPALCIKLLPSQPTINSPQLIENPRYCPVAPPTKSHLDLVRQQVRQRMEEFESNRALAQGPLSGLQERSSTLGTTAEFEQEEHDSNSYHEHLTQVWELWKSIPESQKTQQWHLEALRAISAAEPERKKLSDTIAQLKGEKAHLSIQIQRLNECQQPKEYTYKIPTYHNITSEANKKLGTNTADGFLDPETLIDKWMTVAMESNKTQTALPQFSILDGDDLDEFDIDDDNDEDGEEEGEEDDSADAAGEDDDEVVAQRNGNANNANGTLGIGTGNGTRVNTSLLDRGVLDPSLRDDHDHDSSMEVDGGDFGGESLLAGLRARNQSSGNHGL